MLKNPPISKFLTWNGVAAGRLPIPAAMSAGKGYFPVNLGTIKSNRYIETDQRKRMPASCARSQQGDSTLKPTFWNPSQQHHSAIISLTEICCSQVTGTCDLHALSDFWLSPIKSGMWGNHLVSFLKCQIKQEVCGSPSINLQITPNSCWWCKNLWHAQYRQFSSNIGNITPDGL